MIKLISLNYYESVEEVKPKFLLAYHNINSRVIKLDCLRDSIYYLEKEYNKLIQLKGEIKCADTK
jgi:hypothetical protein|tara:strand:+ start:226 stop:420 length:195 start_codon:yes stop_codon:yes gene_type:complete